MHVPWSPTVLFLWLVSWAAMSIIIAKYFHKKEERWLAYKKKGDAEVARAMTLEGANELAIEAARRRRSEHASRRSLSNSNRRMSERQSSDVRAGVREQLARRAATENDVSRTDDDDTITRNVNDNEKRRTERTHRGIGPGVPAIPPRKLQDEARSQSDRRAVSLDVARPTSS